VTGFNEANTVQAWLVGRLKGLSWEYVPGKDLPRERTDALCEEWVIEAIELLNPPVVGDEERVEQALTTVRSAVLAAGTEALVTTNERMTTLLRGAHTVKWVGQSQHSPLRLIDFDNLANNTLVVSDEDTFGPPGKERRFDVVLWVNGFPLVVVETKTPVNANVSWLNGAREIHNTYEPQCAPFFAANVFSAATEGREFHYGAVGQPAETWLMWGSTADPYDLDGLPRVLRSVELLLRPARVLSILRDFSLFEVPDSGVGKRELIPRYPQVEAAEAIHARILSGGRRGLIWHYQGTGKTLLMAFVSLMLLNDPAVGGPTVVIVLDRLDLIEQVSRQFVTAGLPQVQVAESKADLRRVLAEDQRGIVLTTIFRFADAGELNTRDNIVVLVDEAHRTQEGALGDDMRLALPNARFFGLTGTPIADKERNTFTLFGDPSDPGHVLNAYSIERSIADGASVPVHVETRRVDFHLAAAELDAALAALADEEELTDEQREYLVGKAGGVKTVLLNPDRITEVCTDIVDHYTAKIAPNGLKAQAVAYDRELVVAYQTEINRILAERGLPHETAVVMTVGTSKEEPPEWAAYALTRDQEAAVKRRFNDPDDTLAFLIVTAKLLTGFDAPIDQVMYLDRPLRRHSLFQAITRTNRRFQHPGTGQEKRHGLVVDYIGLGQQIAHALKAADPDTGGKRPVSTDELAEEFVAAIEACLSPRFDGIDRTSPTFETLSAARERLVEREARDAFASDFIAVETLWEFLDPHEILDAHRGDYKWLAQVYEAIKPTKARNELLWHRLGGKTIALVHGHMDAVTVTGTGLEEVVVDPDAIEAMRKLADEGLFPPPVVDPEPITVGEVFDTIEARIRRRLAEHPHPVYHSLAQQIEKLRAQAIRNAEDSIEFLKKALELARNFVQAERLEAAGELDSAAGALLDPHIGALTQIVEEYKPEDTPVVVSDLVRDIDAIVREVSYTGWNETQAGDRTVRKEIRVILKKYALPLTGPLFDNTYANIREDY